MLKRCFALFGAACFAAILAATPASAQRTKLTVYTALENDQLGPFKQAIEAAVPEAEIVWVRDSTGVITARFLAEKDNPRADIVLGLAVTSLISFEKMGLLETYEPKGADKLKPEYRDSKPPYTWTGMDAFLSVACYNTAEGGKVGAKAPVSWKDLTNPVFKGKVVMPHPASSGTGYLTVAAWIQIMGEAEAWKFMDALHENIAVYTHSGSAPCVQAAKGERLIGIGFDMRGAREKTQGAPIDIILPKEGAGWDIEASAIMKNTKKMDAAKKLMDWVATKEANEAYSKNFAIVSHPDVKPALANIPSDLEKRLVKNDFAWAAKNRERILAEWQKRYAAKTEK